MTQGGVASETIVPPAVATDHQTPPTSTARKRALERHQPRNFALLALYQMGLRTGWIFKTESVIMPAFLDLITGGQAGWLRGFLPVINRFGQSVPPLLFARRLKVIRRKKWALMTATFSMSVPFLTLAILCAAASDVPNWLPAVFLILYAIFFICNGLNQLCLGTLQGKLIRVTLRGRLLSVASAAGAITAVGCAIWLMTPWLSRAGEAAGTSGTLDGFAAIFAFTGATFAVSAILIFGLAEPSDSFQEPRASVGATFAAAGRVWRDNADFRRVAAVAAVFATSPILFPHYQALGRTRLEFPLEELMLWVVVQNVGAGIFSLLIGPLADARGNRLALRLLLFATALAPLLAIVLSRTDVAFARNWYFLVFLPIGLTPVALKSLQNYTLEIAPRSEYPRYLSTLSLCIAVPLCLSPVVGWLIDVIGFEIVFLTASALLTFGGVLTFWLAEPRHRAKVPQPTDRPLDKAVGDGLA